MLHENLRMAKHATAEQAIDDMTADADIASVDCVIIGAGVIGLACAREFAQAGREVIVLDAEETHGTQTSSRNSEVLHAGLYYPPGSLRARFCVEGRRRLVDYCIERNVPHRLCGKLIVARDETELPRLDALRAQAAACGAHSLRLWTREDVRAAEPALDVHAALWSPDTGIIDGGALMLALRADAEAAGANFVFRCPVRGIDAAGEGSEGAKVVVHVAGDSPMRLEASTDSGTATLESAHRHM